MSFDILDPQVQIHRNYLLEASAGTGKTFAIENLFVRLLQEPFKEEKSGLTIDQIAVMTFTKAAARDLKKRIRTNIEQKKGEDPRLHAALYAFDQAQISTLHGFCSRSLKMFSFEGGLLLDRPSEEKQTPRALLRNIVHDAFRMDLPGISPAQITLLAKSYGYRQEEIEEDLIELLEKRGKIAPPPSFKTLFEDFLKGMHALRSSGYTHLWEDFAILSTCLKGNNTQAREQALHCFENLLKNQEIDVYRPLVKNSHLIDADRDADFGYLSEEHPGNGKFQLEAGVRALENFLPHWEAFRGIFDPKNLNKRKKLPSALHHPQFFGELCKHLENTMEFLTNPTAILAAIAAKCQELFGKWESNQPLFNPDNLLETMRRAVDDPLFARKIRSKYRAVIVDEFQDTDPIQWEILRELFLTPEYTGFIYLVGDPKQAIYAFRQGDVYTYLNAAKALGEGAAVSLKTNYRSTPRLVEALNQLFNSAKTLFALPRLQGEIPYQSVLAGKADLPLEEGYGALHFMEFEKRGHRGAIPLSVYEAIAHAIAPIQGKTIAILVSSEKQGTQVAEVLKRWNIPSFSQKAPPLSTSPAVKAFIEVLQAVAAPRQVSALKIALGGILLGWTAAEVRTLDQPEALEAILLQFYGWQKILKEKGVAPFFQVFLSHAISNLLEKEGGDTLVQNLNQLSEILAEHQAKTHCGIEGLIQRLHEIATSAEERYKQLLQTEAAVQIITIHSSKGLEFDLVFTPGIASPQYPKKARFIADESGSLRYPILNPDSDQRYQKYQEEMDGERLRLLYVALTRAKERVFIPICLQDPSNSPLDLFLQKMEKPFHTLLSENITLEKIQENYPLQKTEMAEMVLIHPPHIEVLHIPLVLHSFSSLAKTIEHPNLAPLGSPMDFQAGVKTIHTLPAGSDTGNLFHALFEKIPFNSTKDEIEKAALTHTLQGDLKDWSDVISETIYNTYHTPLPLVTGACSLAQMEQLDCYQEMEFCYPYQEGYLKGVIDLIFFYQGYYYLLDWKSNWLGPGVNAYAQHNLEEAMQLHNYFLQAAVYRNALECYLRLIDHRPFEQIYGGMFYLFFRGMDPHDREQKGIFKQ